MDWKKIGKALLFPHIAIMMILVPIATVFLVYSMVFLGTQSVAAYTFTAFTMAIINMVKYRKYNSPVYSASKAISLASACVSMLTLEATMLTTFGAGTMGAITRKIFLGCTGGVISVFVVVMAIYMIRQSSKKLKDLK